ncbi:methyltransferase family protein [Mucilaginibacter glaciei]|uniref:Isoprenylcysteine carboxylmethyltransferase family protein n=1 Tax=Mucilaginibacter glaciei TaxID=2772109 RepID=A0A926NR57_9SPHI|nr:isoprenylcysteine carboxylmethyltransferase family protein [Mucilaginibacter glaciei]MBD1393200.1 isoprenylcysteine carboxylmethyltransferase family protein [Mucilaginibacter glaciei]
MNNLFLGTYIIWFISELVLNRLLKSNYTDKQGEDKHSLLFIWVVVVAAIMAALFTSVSFTMAIAEDYIRYVGLAVIIIGIILRIVAVYTLGKYFTVDVTIREGHQLVKKGLYKNFRHPSYTASFITFIGFGLSLNNWYSLLIVVVAVLAVFLMRIRIEEKALTGQFGDAYLQYKKEAWGLIPFVH